MNEVEMTEYLEKNIDSIIVEVLELRDIKFKHPCIILPEWVNFVWEIISADGKLFERLAKREKIVEMAKRAELDNRLYNLDTPWWVRTLLQTLKEQEAEEKRRLEALKKKSRKKHYVPKQNRRTQPSKTFAGYKKGSPHTIKSVSGVRIGLG
jgi:hypothetical protein